MNVSFIRNIRIQRNLAIWLHKWNYLCSRFVKIWIFISWLWDLGIHSSLSRVLVGGYVCVSFVWFNIYVFTLATLLFFPFILLPSLPLSNSTQLNSSQLNSNSYNKDFPLLALPLTVQYYLNLNIGSVWTGKMHYLHIRSQLPLEWKQKTLWEGNILAGLPAQLLPLQIRTWANGSAGLRFYFRLNVRSL